MARTYVRENVPLSRFGVLVAQIESVASTLTLESPESLLCFDLLSDLISAVDDEPKESVLLWQKKGEDALFALLMVGAARPICHLASLAMAKIIHKGDYVSVFSRITILQDFLSDSKKTEPHGFAGAAQCLGELYHYFMGEITSGLVETTMVSTKLMKFNEEYLRQETLHMLKNALEGCACNADCSGYAEAYRLLTRNGIVDKSSVVRIASARCLKTLADIGGPGLGAGEIDNSASFCVKAFEDPIPSVRDAFAETLASLLALGMNPESQIQLKASAKLEGGLQKHLALTFTKARVRLKDTRFSVTLSWVLFLQALRLQYQQPDCELQNYALQVIDMLDPDISVDAHALACVLYILRVGITDQMTEPNQRSFLVFMGNQLRSLDGTPSMKIAALRTLSYILKALGEVPTEFKEALDDTVVKAVSHSSPHVRIEAALTLRAIAEVDPTWVGSMISYGVTTLSALKENVSFQKADSLKVELDNFHGQATILAALISVSPRLSLGYPARLPKSVLEVSKTMLSETSLNPMVATVEEEVGWILLSSLLASMPKEELEDQVFEILSLWAAVFSGDPEDQINENGDLTTRICVWSAAVDALTAFIRCFISPGAMEDVVFLRPVLGYLNRGLSYTSILVSKDLSNMKSAVDVFIIKILKAYQSLPDPMAYRTDHNTLIELCLTPFREASGCEESSCLRLLLNKRDAWLGPWIPGRNWFEDELRAFEGGKDGLLPCVWDNELSSFPQLDSVNKALVNQKLLCFATMFASSEIGKMLSLIGVVEQCLRSGRRQQWHTASVTNICVALLAGLKSVLALRPQQLGQEILGLMLSIFQNILAEGDICASQRRASSEGLGLLARLGNDVFTARMTRSMLSQLGDIKVATDSHYAGSMSLALGCIHRSAGGMTLSTLVPATVSSLSSLAKSSVPDLQVWSLHGLLLTIEAAGLSFISHVQAMLGLALDIHLSDDNGWLDVQQGVARLINAIIAVLGPELTPGSIFFSRCKSVVAGISSCPETSMRFEIARFTQQLVIFAPQAVSLHCHVQNILPTLSSRQPVLRHQAVSTLNHIIDKDPLSVIEERIEEHLFHMLDEETDSEIRDIVRATIMRLLYASCPSCPSHWMSLCCNMVLDLPTRNVETYMHMETSRNSMDENSDLEECERKINTDKHHRYQTRVFAAECLSHLPTAVGRDPAHFDLSLAVKQVANGQSPGRWLVLQIQELISLACEISTIHIGHMQPVGVGLLSHIIDKFETVLDPELPGHLLLERYQEQLASTVHSALDISSGPVLLEAGLQLATKILTSGMISGDQVAVKQIFSLISQPLDNFNDLDYPSFAEWVKCKIKIRLLAAHASLKCHIFSFLRRHHKVVPYDHEALLQLFSNSSNILGKYWIQILKDLSYICLGMSLGKTLQMSSFLDGTQSPHVLSKLLPCLEEAWPVMLQALVLDAVPVHPENISCDRLTSGYSMVELESEEYQFLWGFALLVLFQGQCLAHSKQIVPLGSAESKYGGDTLVEQITPPGLKLCDIVLPVFQFLSSEFFFSMGFLSVDSCQELLQVFSYLINMDIPWGNLVVCFISEIVENCPEDFLTKESFTHLLMELCLASLHKLLHSPYVMSPEHPKLEELICPLFILAKSLLRHFEDKMQIHTVILAFLSAGYEGIRVASTELCFSKFNDFLQTTKSVLKKHIDDKSKLGDDGLPHVRMMLVTCLNLAGNLTNGCIEDIHILEDKKSNCLQLLQTKLAFSLGETISFVDLAHGIGCFEDDNSKVIFFGMAEYCIRWIQTVLIDSNTQVQAIGVQILEDMLQIGTKKEDVSFLIFFIGELVTDIFTAIEMVLNRRITIESAVTADKCLRSLVLLQKLSKGSESQKDFMKILLEAIVMAFSLSEDGSSQEVNDIRSTAMRLVCHVSLAPSSATQFMDVCSLMPPSHKLKLQDVIRASAAHGHIQNESGGDI